MDDVVLRLNGYAGTDALLVQIRDNSNTTNPFNGGVLATLTNPASQGTGTFNYTFTPSGVFNFIANTTYWLYATVTAGSVNWQQSSPGITPTGITTVTASRRSTNTGSSFVNDTNLNSFQINATPIPEPTTVVGLIAFSVGLLATKKRKQDN